MKLFGSKDESISRAETFRRKVVSRPKLVLKDSEFYVTDEGKLHLPGHFRDLSPHDAVALGHWLIDVFG